MNKKLFSKFLVLALVVGIFGFVAAQRVLAATSATSTVIDNVVPVITAGPSDGGSDGTTPTQAGANVTFSATATDANLDTYYLAVCKAPGITAGSSTAPTCSGVGGAWAVSTATAQNTPASVTYATSSGSAESNDWYAYVCDGNGTPGLCSVVSSGAGSTGSPFKVNHAGTYGTVAVTDTSDGTIAPGDTMKFLLTHGANLADSDTDTVQDTLTMHVCTEATTAYDYVANSCTGGASICDSSAVNPTTTDATCNGGASLVSVPTAHATYHYKVYVEDQHNFPATGTADQTYAVIDVDPVLGTWTVTDAINGSIPAGGSDVIDYAVAVSDDNGDMDVTNVQGIFFDDAAIDLVDGVCSSNEKNCYLQASCTLGAQGGVGTGKTAMGSDKDLTATCAATVWFNANASTDWEFHVNPTDSTVVKTGLASTNENKTVAPLTAIGVTEASIAYGTVAVGGDSSAQTTTMENQGNQILDVLVSGTNMTSTPNTIAAAQQKFYEAGGNFDWASAGVALLTSASAGSDAAGCLNRDLAVRAVHGTGTENEAVSWKIRIPAAQQSGSYTGTNTFATAASSTCSGGPY